MSALASERVVKLLEKAAGGEIADIGPVLDICETHNVAIPDRFKLNVCRCCETFLRPGENVSVRTTGDDIVYRCENCGEVNRHGY